MKRPSRTLRGYRLTEPLDPPVPRPEVEASLLDSLCRAAHRQGGYVDGARCVVVAGRSEP